MSIIVANLSKHYGTQKAVDNISFKINKGEIVGFLGPNGAGKSTTMKMLTTYITPTSGSAQVGNYDIAQQQPEVKKIIGYLAESNPLYYDNFVREYLLLAARLHQVPNAKERVEEVIQLTGLSKEAHKKIGMLSKGYKQRVGIAQAIIHNPEVLILDEPTSGLDPNQLEEIRKLIIDIGKDKAVMLSTHIMQEVEAMCDRVLIINNGKIVKEQIINETVSHKTNPQIVLTFNSVEDKEKIKALLSGKTNVQAHSEHSIVIELNDIVTKKFLMTQAVNANVEIAAMEDYSLSMEDVFRQATR